MPPEVGEELEKSTQLAQSRETVDLWNEMSEVTLHCSKWLCKGKNIMIK